MNRRLKWILAVGALAAIALLTASRWLNHQNRIVPMEEIHADSARRYEAQIAWLNIRPRRLAELDEKYQIAVESVTNALKRHGINPSEFRAVVEELREERQYVFHLHHLSAFEARREAKKIGMDIIGNPGGKSCNVVFDIRTREASRPMLWQ
jgi:hypothetical protein